MTNKKYQNKNKKIDYQGGYRKELVLFEPRTLLIIILTSILTLLIVFFGKQGAKFMTSVISPVPEHAPYNGTTFPVKQIPNWVKLSEAERKAPYSAISADKLVSIPSYNPAVLAIPNTSLKWNDSSDDAVRNAKITYSVPYLGSYKMDGLENSGSHPAIDIKIPVGTPVYAIANGTVIKAQYSNGGFGNHVVIQHNNFPSADNPAVTKTIYSAYAHLSSFSVGANDVVTKGQLIGFSGESGIATTPHLHFQIDSDSAPWHPYWPFTTADMNTAGYSFFTAINNGLGQSNAIANTINPMRYVQKFAGDQVLVAASAPEFVTQIPAAAEDPYDSLSFVLQSIGSRFEEGGEVKFVIQAFDKSGNLISNPKFADDIKLALLNSSGELNRQKITAAYLKTGITSLIKAGNLKPGRDKLILKFRDREFSSPEYEVVQKKIIPAGFLVLPAKSVIQTNENLNVMIRAVDSNGNLLTQFELDQQPVVSTKNSIGSLSANLLYASNFFNGEASVTFTSPSAAETAVSVYFHGLNFESSNIGIIEPSPPPELEPAAPAPAENQTDTQANQPQAPQEETVSAELAAAPAEFPEERPAAVEPPSYISAPAAPFANNNERPAPAEDNVGSVAAETGSQTADSSTAEPQTLASGPFTDIPADNPYAAILTELKASGMITGYADSTFQPEREVTRAEAVTMILRAINEPLREKLTITFSDVDAESWYAKFVNTAYEAGFVRGNPDGTFKPEATVNLAEFFTMLFVASKIDVDPQILIALPAGVAGGDWFAPYLQEAITKNILEVENNTLDPAKLLTRGDIAKILYRLKQVEKTEM